MGYRGRHSTSGRWRSDGGALSLEMVVLLPLAFSLLFLAVQGAVYYQGRTVALASAQQGARDAAGLDKTDGDGRAGAIDFANRAGGSGLLEEPQVAVHRNRSTRVVTVEVTGKTMSLVPGWDPVVTQSASRTVEEFSRPEEFQGRYTNKPKARW